MKKVLFLALSLTVAGFSAHAQDSKMANVKVAGPAITFEEVKYDFGSIGQGGIVDHVFKFKNTGTQPLIISNIGVSCGCTTPEWTKDPVMPGKTGTIAAHFNTAGKMGMQNKVLTVESNASAGSATLALVSEIKEAGAPAMAAESAGMKAMTMDSGNKMKDKSGDTKMKVKHKK